MIRYYFKIAFRNFRRFRIYSVINLIGLALGLTVGVLTLLFVLDELSFDNFHENKDRIYKIVTSSPDGGMETNAWPVAYKLKTEFPQVETVVYSRRAPSNMMMNYEGKRYQHEIFYADEAFFRIFSFPFLEGDPSTALLNPFSIVITEKMKDRYFGTTIALGKSITLRDSLEFTVTGVVENVPSNSHIQFDMLLSFSTYTGLVEWFSYREGWGNFNVRNYLLLKEDADLSSFEAKARNIYKDNVGDWMDEMGVEFYVDFIPLNDIYLRSSMSNGFGPQGSINQVKMVAAIGIFVILLACINFINISTARSVYRAKEVGIRKIAGSSRWTLFRQFMLESVLHTLIAFAFVVLIIDLILPAFNMMMGKNLDILSILDWQVLVGVLLLLICISLLAGYYPAIVISGFKPADVLKGQFKSGRSGIRLRRTLVIFQFLISAILILGTLLVIKQLNYMRNQDLGFDKEQILVLDATNLPKTGAIFAFKEHLKSLSSVESISFTNALPGRPGWQGQWAYPEKTSEETQVDTEYMAIDEDYIETLGLELIAGRNFDPASPADLEEGLIINERTVMEMGWQEPENAIGKMIVSPSQYPQGKVIGVVKDYHGLGLQHHIWPKAMDYSSQTYGRYYAIRFVTGSTSELLDNVKNGWQNYFDDFTFDYFFLNQDFDRQYRAEERLMRVLMLFATLGIAIASIGLLGLISFMALTRIKEIGVRKVLGASVFNITGLLSREFLMLVLLADLLAIPIVWYFGNNWIETYAYHTRMSIDIFVINLVITLILAGFTVSFQTIRAALTNPVDTLRNE